MPPKQTHKESRPEKMLTPEHRALFEALESIFSILGTLLESRKLSFNNLILGGSSYWLRWFQSLWKKIASWDDYSQYMAVCQNLVPLVNFKIAGKWMFIPLKMVLRGIDPYPYGKITNVYKCNTNVWNHQPELCWWVLNLSPSQQSLQRSEGWTGLTLELLGFAWPMVDFQWVKPTKTPFKPPKQTSSPPPKKNVMIQLPRGET